MAFVILFFTVAVWIIQGSAGGRTRFTVNAPMVVLGAILASIPAKSLRYRREFGGYVLIKMILFPAIVLGA